MVVIWLSYQMLDQAVTIDDLRMAVTSHENREACLLGLSRSHVSTMTSEELVRWVEKNLGDLDVHREDSQLIVNGVGFDLTQVPPTVE